MKFVNNKFFLKTLPIIMLVVFSVFAGQNNANAAPRAAIRGTASAVGRQPVTKVSTPTPASVQTESVTVEPVTAVAETTIEPIMNKSNQFDDVLSASTSTSSAMNTALADMLREQRAAFDLRDTIKTAADNSQKQIKSGKNACDDGLRKCMSDDKVCGSDFTKCATDGDTDFGNKLNKCRRDTTCTGEEFKLFTTEIKADRDANVELASYNSVINCGNTYMDCIVTECGKTFNKCLGKSASDTAMNKCKSIATRCKEQDAGLPGRFGSVIGKLRENAEVNVKRDEERMYKLRELMKNACTKLGAMFDERNFDCVYTVNFFAGKEQTTPMSSRKARAGTGFTCNQEYFGIDVTTFKENAYRETRAQTGASSAFLGAGVGTTVGLVASGAMGRAIERQKAENAVKKAKADAKKDDKKEDGGKDAKEEDKKEDGANDAKEDDKKEDGAQGGGDKAEEEDPFVQDIDDDEESGVAKTEPDNQASSFDINKVPQTDAELAEWETRINNSKPGSPIWNRALNNGVMKRIQNKNK